MTVAVLGAVSWWLAASDARADAPPDYYAQSLASTRVLQHWYNAQGLWDTTGWWNAANCLEVVERMIELNNGAEYLEVLRATFDRNRTRDFLNEFYDDEGWWALAWVRAYDLTGERHYLRAAQTIFTDMASGWDDHCGGGVWWKKDRRYKNAIPNELFLLLAARLHQRTPGDRGPGSYLDWAQREWEWFKASGLINAGQLVNDGLNAQCENNRQTTWTYNQGVIIGGLVELYRSTGRADYLAQAIAIGDAATTQLVNAAGILREPNERRGLRGGDGPQFKGIFIRHLAELYEVTGFVRYREFMERNAKSVWENNRDAEGRFGGRWAGPVDAVDAARHSSALRVICALAEPRLAADAESAVRRWLAPALEHEVGRSRGATQWVAEPATDHASGYLVKGALPEDLASGDCDAAFELKVDYLAGIASALARISIWDVATGQEVAGRELRGADFSNALYHTFTLRFQVVAGHSYEARTFWYRDPAAPALTHRNITVRSTD
ncbi:MAG: glycoside hydrolase family 76 protein [Verrucomicrobiae bacterium]|nr:glycoside hydrolase family 76 protein [Verrucomicrobiae bacterium]